MYEHTPVLLREALTYLDLKSNDHVIDCTVGGGGHAAWILDRIAPKGRLLALDLDPQALARSKRTLAPFASWSKNKDSRLILVHENFANLEQVVSEYPSIHPVKGILFDLGVSSFELQDASRGFSFLLDGPLDMRFNSWGSSRSLGDRRNHVPEVTAEKILNQWSEAELKRIIKAYGEDPHGGKIAKAIVQARKKRSFKTTQELVNLIEGTVRTRKGVMGIHPATRTFQALRIQVNDELENLKRALPQALNILQKGGRMVVVSFHSLEDRIVKRFFQQEQKGCICPPFFPTCQCGHKPRVRILTTKPITPQQDELRSNPRSRSAKLRALTKVRT